MSTPNQASVTIDVGTDGIILVDPADRIEVDGWPEPVITWRIPFSHAEALATVLDAFDKAAGLLREASEPGSRGATINSLAVPAIEQALMHLEATEVIYKAAGGWYLQVQTCRRCGCTDLAACDPPCSWVQIDLCSRCVA